MSRATINTGGIDFNSSEQSSNNIARDGSTAMHIAILADFSGRKSRNDIELNSLSSRKVIEIHRDNFEEIFEKINVQLQLPVSDELLAFKELDDLHPDFIYERISLFDKLRILKRKLNKKDSFDSAAEEIQAWANYRGQQRDTQQPTEGIPLPQSLLDAALQGLDIASQLDNGPLGNIDKLIKDIVSPFVESKSDPRKADMLKAVEEATSETMRAIMHHSDFQQLEASWRGLYWLIRRIEAGENLRLFIMDVTKKELHCDLDKPAADSYVYQQLVESRKTADGTPFGLILGDYQLYNGSEDAGLASQMATLASHSNGCWISGGHEQLAGCHALSDGVDPDNWQLSNTQDPQDPMAQDKWQQMRMLPCADHLALAAPRFLLRLPFGRKTSSTDSFDYEELTSDGAHDFYLWGNGAFVVIALLAEGFSREGWTALPGNYTEVEDLPLHVYDDEGDSAIKPCAEVLLTDRAASALNNSGLLALRSVQNKDSVRVTSFVSVASNKRRIQGLW